MKPRPDYPEPRVDLDRMRHLSDLTRRTRKPGQTLQSRLYELRRELGA